jgi:hypothetical protein
VSEGVVLVLESDAAVEERRRSRASMASECVSE